MRTIIGFTGYAGSGKDTAVSALAELGFERIAFADPIRAALVWLNPIVSVTNFGTFRVLDIVEAVGWDQAKRSFPEIRTLLQRMGTEVGRGLFGKNFWIDVAIARMNQLPEGTHVAITDVRFPDEGDAIRSIGGAIVRIWTERVPTPPHDHPSELLIDEIGADYDLHNDGTEEEFRADVRALAEGIIRV